MAGMKALIDTNVILDALVSREPFRPAAEAIFLLAAEGSIDASVTASCLTDIYYLLKRHLKSTEQSKEALGKLLAIFNVLDVTKRDCLQAMELPMDDYEDALLAATGRRANVDCIVTRDLNDFKASPVKTVSPEDFIRNLRAKTNSQPAP